MEKLKPCPFCGGKVEHQLMYDGAYSFTCSSCGLNARFTDDIARAVPSAIDGTEMIWNTRYEHTCHMVKDPERDTRSRICSNCNGYMSLSDNYCPKCGAKVVPE